MSHVNHCMVQRLTIWRVGHSWSPFSHLLFSRPYFSTSFIPDWPLKQSNGISQAFLHQTLCRRCDVSHYQGMIKTLIEWGCYQGWFVSKRKLVASPIDSPYCLPYVLSISAIRVLVLNKVTSPSCCFWPEIGYCYWEREGEETTSTGK